MKIIFLDYDGVVNTPIWDESGKCGKVAVDGGHDYCKREFPKFPTEDHYIELSVIEENDDGK